MQVGASWFSRHEVTMGNGLMAAEATAICGKPVVSPFAGGTVPCGLPRGLPRGHGGICQPSWPDRRKRHEDDAAPHDPEAA